MPSRLSSLLVRDGLVGVKRMEKAFQRQVIYGGSLDTILLEMALVPEDRLLQYLALASGLPPAARDEGQVVEAAAVALLSRELAERYRAVPVAIEGEAVRLLVCAPLEIAELEDLADLLDRPVGVLDVGQADRDLVAPGALDLGLGDAEGVGALADRLDGVVERLLGHLGHLRGGRALVHELDAALEVEPELRRLRRDHPARGGEQRHHDTEDREVADPACHRGVSTSRRPPSSS